jgi:hypothetical protein
MMIGTISGSIKTRWIARMAPLRELVIALAAATPSGVAIATVSRPR